MIRKIDNHLSHNKVYLQKNKNTFLKFTRTFWAWNEVKTTSRLKSKFTGSYIKKRVNSIGMVLLKNLWELKQLQWSPFYLAQKLCFWTVIIFIGVYVSVCVGLSLYNLSQKVLDRFWWSLAGWCITIKDRSLSKME